MLNIKKEKSNFGEIIIISNSENSLKIMMGGNGDLYFSPLIKKENSENRVSFIINDFDSELYPLFNNLYEKIINYEPFIETSNEVEDDLFALLVDVNRDSKYYRRKDMFREFPLVNENVIMWYSDDDIKEIASILTIKKENNQIILEITKSHPQENRLATFNIRICNDGSYYDPFNTCFMELYNELCKVDLNYHQVTIQECNHNLKKLYK